MADSVPEEDGISSPTFQDLDLSPEYRTGDQPLESFYIPVLQRASSYDRAAGYFDSKSLQYAAQGIAGLITNGGTMRLLTTPRLQSGDIQALTDAATEPEELEILGDSLSKVLFEDEYAEYLRTDRCRCLAWMITEGFLEVRIAYMPDADDCNPFQHYHEKIGVVSDHAGNQVAFTGSINETGAAWTANYESFDVFRSWCGGEEARVQRKADAFERLWNNHDPKVTVRRLPDAVREGFEEVSPETVDGKPALDMFFSEEGEGPSPTVREQDERELWTHQQDAIEWWRDHDYTGIFAMATGAGKTLTALRAARLQADIRLTIITVPSKVLLDQWRDEIEAVFGPETRIQECSGRTNWRESILQLVDPYRVGSLQSVHNLPRTVLLTTIHTAASDPFRKAVQYIPPDNLQIIIDEVHNAGAPTFQKALEIDAGRRIGLSATPDRQWDEEGTEAIYEYFGGHDPFSFTTSDAIENGYLTPYEYHPLICELTAQEYERYAELSAEINTLAARVHSEEDVPRRVLDQYEQLLRDRAHIKKTAKLKPAEFGRFLESSHPKPAIVFCEDTEQLEELEAELSDRDLSYGVYISNREDEQADAMYRFENGLIDYLLAIKCLDEGIDVPDAPTAVIIASSRNEREFIQRRGRVLRQSESKERAVIYDMFVLPGPNAPKDDDQARRLIEQELDRAKVLMRAAENRDAVEQQLAEELDTYGSGYRYLAYV